MGTSKSPSGDDAGRAQPFLDSSESLSVGEGVCAWVGAVWVNSAVVPSTGASFPWEVGVSSPLAGRSPVPAAVGAGGGGWRRLFIPQPRPESCCRSLLFK